MIRIYWVFDVFGSKTDRLQIVLWSLQKGEASLTLDKAVGFRKTLESQKILNSIDTKTLTVLACVMWQA